MYSIYVQPARKVFHQTRSSTLWVSPPPPSVSFSIPLSSLLAHPKPTTKTRRNRRNASPALGGLGKRLGTHSSVPIPLVPDCDNCMDKGYKSKGRRYCRCWSSWISWVCLGQLSSWMRRSGSIQGWEKNSAEVLPGVVESLLKTSSRAGVSLAL
ncbi:unnamed protein product [Periconia digitata]|uniref:Uncharacterized protein n=1 Tax=Periconia digitata TaxID=1303443 RepID=A0A9W4UJR8_9PLEO|nr:unnamed protein product [Periconia digitata]